MRAGFGSHETFSITFSKNRGQREKMLERDSERENHKNEFFQNSGGVPLLLMGFIILPLFLGLPFAKKPIDSCLQQRDNLWKRGTLTKLYKSKEFPQSFEKIRFPLFSLCTLFPTPFSPFPLLLHFVKQGNFDFWESIDHKETSLTYSMAEL